MLEKSETGHLPKRDRKERGKKKTGGGGRVEWGVKRRFTSNVKNLVAVAPEEPFDL